MGGAKTPLISLITTDEGRMSKKRKQEKIEAKQRAAETVVSSSKVKMIFRENKFYNDLKKPIYLAGVVYEIEPNMVQRWLKRGGKIVEVPVAKPEVEPQIQEPVESSEEKSEDVEKS